MPRHKMLRSGSDNTPARVRRDVATLYAIMERYRYDATMFRLDAQSLDNDDAQRSRFARRSVRASKRAAVIERAAFALAQKIAQHANTLREGR